MSDHIDTLSELLQIEAAIYDRLNSVIADIVMEDSDVDALSLRYENCVKGILNYTAKSAGEAIIKCDFIFMMIGRSYNESELLAAMQDSLKKDIERISAK